MRKAVLLINTPKPRLGSCRFAECRKKTVGSHPAGKLRVHPMFRVENSYPREKGKHRIPNPGFLLQAFQCLVRGHILIVLNGRDLSKWRYSFHLIAPPRMLTGIHNGKTPSFMTH